MDFLFFLSMPLILELRKVLISVKNQDLNLKNSSLGGFEPPTFRLTAERASRLRHRDLLTFIREKLFFFFRP